jgi:hypothetical protein
MSGNRLAILLACFDEPRAAAKARRSLESDAESNGGKVLDTVVYRVNEKHKASVSDPRRAVRGALSAGVTWGLFGLVAGTDKLESLVIWAVLGVICGGLYGYYSEHLLSKHELARIGEHLPAKSSAVVSFAESRDADAWLKTASTHGPAVASVGSIDDDLSAHVTGGGDGEAQLSMIMLRYGERDKAKNVASDLSTNGSHKETKPQVELVIETDPRGRRHVADPKQGVRAMARSDVISWGGFGLVFGVIVGLAGGGGILGFLEDGIVTGIGWGIFGLAAGMLYGLLAGRAVSAHRLEGIGPILPPGTSMIIAWADGAVSEKTIDKLAEPNVARLTLRFNAVEGGLALGAPR